MDGSRASARDAGFDSPPPPPILFFVSMTVPEVIRLAFLKGYRIDAAGQVISPSGKVRKLSKHTANGYSRYRFNIDPDFPPVEVHRLVSFQKFGEASFEHGVQTRHLNNNSLDNAPTNIAIGTPSQNAYDQDPQKRKRHAAKCFQHYTAEFVETLRREYAGGLGYKLLRAKYGVPLATLSYYLSVTAKKRSFTYPLT